MPFLVQFQVVAKSGCVIFWTFFCLDIRIELISELSSFCRFINTYSILFNTVLYLHSQKHELFHSLEVLFEVPLFA